MGATCACCNKAYNDESYCWDEVNLPPSHYPSSALRIAAMPKRQSAILSWITMTVTFDLPRMGRTFWK